MLTAQGSGLLAFIRRSHGSLSSRAEAAITAFEGRFRTFGSGKWWRKPISSGAELRLPNDDDRQFLQSVADYNALWMGSANIPAGSFRTDNSIFVTHGIAFPWSTGRFVGAGLNFDGSSSFRGTTIIASRGDRPALISQGGRKDRISDLSIVGPLRDYIMEQGFGTGAAKADDTDPRAWDLGSIGDKRWAPLAGIAVDPLADGMPPAPYPPLPVPDYLGSPVERYGRQVTSDVLIERVMISGFNVGLVVHPAPGVSQGDYVHGQDLTIEACKYGVSVGNTQSRLPSAVHRHIARVFCGFTNRQHGARQGFFGGTETSGEVGSCIKVFDFDLSYLGNFTFDGLYTEACWQLGDLQGATALDGSLTIRGAHLNHSYPSGDYVPRRGVPRYQIGDPTQPTGYVGTGQVVIEGSFLSFRTICPLMIKNLALNRVQLYSLEADGTASSLARAVAHNGSMGLAMPPGNRPAPAIVTAPCFDLTTLKGGAARTTDENFAATDRNSLIPWFITRARPRTHVDDRHAVEVPLIQFSAPASAYAVMQTRGTELTMRSTISPEQANNSGQAPGCLVLHDLDGRWYYIKSRNHSAGTAVFEALTDYHDPGTGVVLRTPYVATGTLHFCETRLYTPSVALIGDATRGSAAIRNLRGLDGASVAEVNDVVAGDYMWADPHAEGIFAPGANRVTDADFRAGVLMMSGPASSTQTGLRLGLFLRSL